MVESFYLSSINIQSISKTPSTLNIILFLLKPLGQKKDEMKLVARSVLIISNYAAGLSKTILEKNISGIIWDENTGSTCIRKALLLKERFFKNNWEIKVIDQNIKDFCSGSNLNFRACRSCFSRWIKFTFCIG
jgi:hypothetical protein